MTEKKENKVNEVLYMSPSYFSEGTFSQSLAIAPVMRINGDDYISFVSMISSSVPEIHSNFTRFQLTKEEVIIIIKALQESLEWLDNKKREYQIEQLGCNYE